MRGWPKNGGGSAVPFLVLPICGHIRCLAASSKPEVSAHKLSIWHCRLVLVFVAALGQLVQFVFHGGSLGLECRHLVRIMFVHLHFLCLFAKLQGMGPEFLDLALEVVGTVGGSLVLCLGSIFDRFVGLIFEGLVDLQFPLHQGGERRHLIDLVHHLIQLFEVLVIQLGFQSPMFLDFFDVSFDGVPLQVRLLALLILVYRLAIFRLFVFAGFDLQEHQSTCFLVEVVGELLEVVDHREHLVSTRNHL
mmetsp:Transcript_57016/g.124728  ORF Transcript_57016/g.124728 Transcript_57016/m.124728 type:complete len:248 (-) Transcript_57016:1833-2576(-)